MSVNNTSFHGMQNFADEVNLSQCSITPRSVCNREMKKGEIAVRVTQADLNGMENERNRLRNTVTQLAEENKGLLLLQESAQRQLEEAKIKILNYESESKELKSRLQHADNIAEELH